METKNGFRGDYDFLSNFHMMECPLIDGGISYISVERYYQALKFVDLSIREQIAYMPASQIKEFVRQNKHLVRVDWKRVRELVMMKALTHKFSIQNSTLRYKLMLTSGVDLIEYNTWGDTYWGKDVTTKQGRNRLGEMLMQIRDGILGESPLQKLFTF